MASKSSYKNDCLDCENYKRKIQENEQTVSARDVLIEMLQTELKKKETLFRNAIDEHEKLRFMHCSVVQDYTNLKEIHKKLTEENRKLYDEKQALIAKLREYENSSNSSAEYDSQFQGEKNKEITNIRSVADGITNIQNIMQCQNKSLRTMLMQLIEEFKKSRMDRSPERECQSLKETLKNPAACKCESGNKEEAYICSIECLKKQIESLTSFIEKLKKENKKIKENLYEKQSSLSNCLTVLENNNADIDNLSEHIQGLCKERDKYKEEVTALEIELLAKEHDVEELKLQNEKIHDLKRENSKVIRDNNYLNTKIEKCMTDSGELRKHLEDCLQNNLDLEKKTTELEKQLKEKEREFTDYKTEMLTIIDNIKSELQPAAVESNTQGTQCKKNCPAVCNKAVQETPSTNHKNTQCLKDCPAVCNEKIQVDDLDLDELSLCPRKCTGKCNRRPEKEVIDLETHELEMQALEKEYFECKCVFDDKIKHLEEENQILQENISVQSDKYEQNIDKLKEDFKHCKCILEDEVHELEKCNSNLKESLATEEKMSNSKLENLQNEYNTCVCELKKKIIDLEEENKMLRETIDNFTSEGKQKLKKLEQNYCLCKNALENKIKQLEEESKTLKETLEIIAGDKNTENEFDACICVLENKIKILEKENKTLKDSLITTTNDYDSKLKSMEEEFFKTKTTLENKIKSLEEEKSNLQTNLLAIEQKESNRERSEDDLRKCKCTLEHRINILESENKSLTDTLTKERAENQTIIKKLRDDSVILQNTLEEQIQVLQEQNECFQQIIQENNINEANVIDVEEYYECKCALEEKIEQLKTQNRDLQQNLSIVNCENRSNLNKINELSRQLRIANANENRTQGYSCDPNCGIVEDLQAGIGDATNYLQNETDNLRDEINQLQEKLATLEKELETANLELTEYEEENRSYAQRLQSLLNEITCLQEAKFRAEEDNIEYTQRMSQMRQEFAKLTQERDQTIKELNQKITNLECKLVDFDKNVSKLTELIEENKELQDKLHVNEATLLDIQNELIKIQSENDKLKSLEDLEKQKDEQLKKCYEQLKTIQEQLEDNKCKCENYEKKIGELEKNKLILEDKISKLEASVEDTSKETEHLRNIIADLEKRRDNINLEEIEKDNQELLEQLNTFQEQLEFKQSMIKSLEECINKSNSILENCEKEMKAVQEDNEKLRDELDKKVEELKVFLDENKKLKEELNDYQLINDQISKLRQEYNNILKENQMKEEELETIKQELLEYKDERKVSKSKYTSQPNISSTRKSKEECTTVSKKSCDSSCRTGGKKASNTSVSKEPSPSRHYSSGTKPATPSKSSTSKLKGPVRSRSSSKELSPVSKIKSKDSCQGKPCPYREKQASIKKSTDKAESICPTLGKPCSSKTIKRSLIPTKKSKEENLSGNESLRCPNQKPCPTRRGSTTRPSRNTPENICPLLGKPCPIRTQKDSVAKSISNDDKDLEDIVRNSPEDICPALGEPCRFRSKRESYDTSVAQSDNEDFCQLGTPGPTESIESIGANIQDGDEYICPTIGKPCPARTKNDTFDKIVSPTAGVNLCPILAKPCPYRADRDSGKTTEEAENDLSSMMGKPQTGRDSIAISMQQVEENICPTLGKPCPVRTERNSGSKSKDQGDEDIYLLRRPGLSRSSRDSFSGSKKRDLSVIGKEEEEGGCSNYSSCPYGKRPNSTCTSRSNSRSSSSNTRSRSLSKTNDLQVTMGEVNDLEEIRSVSGCKCVKGNSPRGSRSTSNRVNIKNAASDPIQELHVTPIQVNKNNCNCMQVIMKEYKSFEAELDIPQTYDILDVDPGPSAVSHSSYFFQTYVGESGADTLFKKPFIESSQTDLASCFSEKIKSLYSYDDFPEKFKCRCDDNIEANLEGIDLCRCEDSSSTSSRTSS